MNELRKYNLLFTLDYEIHGNGDGNPMELMVEPTYRLMTLLEKYNQRVTIMTDVAEILCFKRYADETGRDDYHVAEIETQLCDAIKRGHDVQLHVHSSYFKAVHKNGAFDQCIEEYNMAALPIERIDEMVGQCVEYLENLLRPIKKDYRVWLFRAANWSMMPTENLYRVLVNHGITHDTSVFKGGVQGGNVCYDYREAYDNLFAYPASMKNINKKDESGELIEMPIYTEMRPFWDFVSFIRIYRMIRAKFHRHKDNKENTISENNQENNLEVIKKEESSVTLSNSTSLDPQSVCMQASRLSDAQSCTDTDKSYLQDSSEKNELLHNSQKNTKKINAAQINKEDNRKLSIKSFFRLSPLKMDFNQVNSRGLKRMMRNIMRRVDNPQSTIKNLTSVDVILIGHSKTFVPYNEKTLEPFLKWFNKRVKE